MPVTEIMRAAIDAGLRAFCSETGDFDMSPTMRRSAVDHIMSQPGMFARNGTGGPMIEQMARAIWDNREQHQNERCRQSWERGSELARQFTTDHARAALATLLRPSQPMIRAVDDEDSDPMVARGRAYSAFVSMIQAALDEETHAPTKGLDTTETLS
jgi:hypothetical protein